MAERTGSADRIHVLIADDHPVFRYGVKALLAASLEAEVVGEATTGQDSIIQAEQLRPDVILMDVHMPGEFNGIEATRRILSASPHVGIVVLTMLEDDQSVFAAMRAGARGYVVKGADPQDLLYAVRTVAAGGVVFSPTSAQQVLRYFLNDRSTPPDPASAMLFPDLTEREREVLALIARGYTNSAIAEHLVLSSKTVRNHVSNVFSKLQVADRAQAVIRARDAGLA